MEERPLESAIKRHGAENALRAPRELLEHLGAEEAAEAACIGVRSVSASIAEREQQPA